MAPIVMRKVSGKLPVKNIDLDQALDYLTITDSQYSPPEALKVLGTQKSYYHSLFDKGADIYPRRLWFINVIKHGLFSFNPKKPHVETDPDIEAKPPWNRAKVSGNVEARFVFGTILGSDLVPFGILRFRPIIMPVLLRNGKLSLIKGPGPARRLGYPGLAECLEQVEDVWSNLGRGKKLGLYEWLNFRNKLTKQNPNASYKVLYVGSATYLAATVVDQRARIFLDFDGVSFPLQGFVAESKTYQLETNNIQEASYLCAILNSKIVDNAIKPSQTRGLWGARDIHKRPLLLPIPKFSQSNKTHRRIAEIGIEAEREVRKIIPDVSKYKSIGKARSYIREVLADKLVELDELVVSAISESSDTKGLFQFIE